jgi:hypothetical protein
MKTESSQAKAMDFAEIWHGAQRVGAANTRAMIKRLPDAAPDARSAYHF